MSLWKMSDTAVAAEGHLEMTATSTVHSGLYASYIYSNRVDICMGSVIALLLMNILHVESLHN